MENVNKITPEETPAPKARKRFNPLKVLNGEFLQQEGVLKHIPFLFFMTFIAAIYIANKYYGENKVKEITQLKKQVKEAHSEYIATKVRLTDKSKGYMVEKSLEDRGIMIPTFPARVLAVDSKKAKDIW